MSIYIQSLFFAIPIFAILIAIEALFAIKMGIKVNRSADMISSLSSGLTDTIKSGIKFTISIISYSWLVENLSIYELKPIWLAVIIAFITQDFAGYWLHRLNHRVNILWNKHIIHHSSEEFNLSCALRQSISDTLSFAALFMIPAAILGIPTSIFAIVTPIHLFLQFWYHTQIIDKMGWLESIIVTPSHHRVHHAINKEYLDKNYGQIFIIWDKIFGSFQQELSNVKPVYGILRPAQTWNPIIINYKHIWQLIKDAWYTKNIKDKLIIWFMPTGWRPKDVSIENPLETITNPYRQKKYHVDHKPELIIWSWIQLNITLISMFHLFITKPNLSNKAIYVYAFLLMLHIFSYTATMDQKQYAVITDFVKLVLGLILIYVFGFSWFGLGAIFTISIATYLLASFGITFYFLKRKQLVEI